MLYKRSIKAKAVIDKFLKDNPPQGNEVVPVVFHSQMIAALTSKGVEGEGKDEKFKDHIWTQNC